MTDGEAVVVPCRLSPSALGARTDEPLPPQRPARTALDAVHRALGATMTDFAGWDMPLRYGSERDEHNAVRTRAGLFDLSHMGEITVTGPQAGRRAGLRAGRPPVRARRSAGPATR